MADKLTLRVKLSYGAGDIYGGGATTLISMYYLYFLTASAACRVYPVTRGRHASLKELLAKRHAGEMSEDDLRTERELKAAFGEA